MGRQAICRIADYCSVEELGFLIFDRGVESLPQVSTVGNTGHLFTLGKKASWHCP
jgi:hypothetical protein